MSLWRRDIEKDHYPSAEVAREAYEHEMVGQSRPPVRAKDEPLWKQWNEDDEDDPDDPPIRPGDRVTGSAVEHSIHDHEWDTGIVLGIDSYGRPIVKWEVYPHDHHEHISLEVD